MLSKTELQQQLRDEFGSDEFPLVKEVKISSLSLEELQNIMAERNIDANGSRQQLEESLSNALDGSDEVVLVETVKIELLNVGQLEEALSKISKPKKKKKTIRETQQEMAENCGFGEDIIWDLLSSKDDQIMRDKIKHLIPDQEKGQSTIEQLREVLFNNIWAQRKYTNGNSVTYIFYVMVTNDKDFNTAADSNEFSCHPVFRCKKCDDTNNSKDCCMIYIDETGRVYQNWKSYIDENVLPGGTMIAPRNGIYNFNRNDEVILDIYCTPNGTTGAMVMNAAQTSTAVMGIGAACVPLAALALPIAAPVMATAGLIGLGVGAFSAITSTFNLTDRKKHEQSISITDRQARASYLGLAGGVIGVAAAGATRVMTSMAAAGRATLICRDVKSLKNPNPKNGVHEGVELFVNGINISSIVLSGSGVANGVLDLILKYNDSDKITSLDILQLSASLVIFTHSVYNFQLASQIANEARTNSIKNYRETLSNRQRKAFDKMSKETVRIRGSTQGRMDIIRNINEIPDRQYLNNLFKINKQLNQRDVRPAFGGPGEGVVLNNELPVDTGVLRQSVQHNQGPNILDHITQPIPQTHNSDTHSTTTPTAARLLFSTGDIRQNSDLIQDPFSDNNSLQTSTNLISILRNLSISLPSGAVIIISQFGEIFLKNIADGQKFQDVILSMADNFPEKTLKFLIGLAQKFIENSLGDILRVLRLFIPTESVLYRMVKHVLDNFHDLSYEFISTKGNEIENSIRTYYLSLNPNNNPNLLKQCPDCNGKNYICTI